MVHHPPSYPQSHACSRELEGHVWGQTKRYPPVGPPARVPFL